MTTRRWPRLLLLSLLLFASSSVWAEEWIYTVRPGDSLWSISNNYLKGIAYWPRVQTHNNITDPKQIKPGTRLRIRVEWLKNPPQPAIVARLSGSVEVVDAAGKRRQAQEGDKLVSGEVIRTGTNGSVTLRFADESTLLIQSNSVVSLDSVSSFGEGGMIDTSVRLHHGRVDSRVEKRRDNTRFMIITPAAIAAVRGTRFRVSAEEERAVMRSEVLEGRVDVEGNQATVELPAGYGTLAEQGKAPLPPRPLLPAPDLSKLSAEYPRDAVTLAWPAVSGASRYRIQVAESEAFSAILQDVVTSEPALQLTALEPGKYACRIRAIDEIGLEGADAIAHFDVAAPPNYRLATPNVLAPQITHDTLLLRWQSTTPGTHYRVHVAEDEGFSKLIGEAVVDADHVLMPAPGPGEYYYRVQAFDDQGEVSQYSGPDRFMVYFPSWTVFGFLIPLLFML
ncbi:MAG: FecR domain-containing protein [Pseudomonadota bacterium]